MILRRDAPVELPESLVMKPNMAEVKKLFDFLEFRTFAERLADALGPAAVVLSSDEREQLVAEVTESESPAAIGGDAGGARPPSTSPPSWEGEAGRAPLAGLAVVTDGDDRRRDVDPGDHLDDPAVAAALAAAAVRATTPSR